MMHLTDMVKTVRVNAPAVAGTSDINTTGVNMAGFNSVRFIIGLGTITSGAVTSVKAQQSSDDGAVDTYADIAGTSITVADTGDDKLYIIDIYNPAEDYVRATIDRGTQNAVLDLVIAELYNAKTLPVTQDATVGGHEEHVAPIAGTA